MEVQTAYNKFEAEIFSRATEIVAKTQDELLYKAIVTFFFNKKLENLSEHIPTLFKKVCRGCCSFIAFIVRNGCKFNLHLSRTVSKSKSTAVFRI